MNNTNELIEIAFSTQIQQCNELPTDEVKRLQYVVSKAKNLLLAMDVFDKGIGTALRIQIAREELKKACQGL